MSSNDIHVSWRACVGRAGSRAPAPRPQQWDRLKFRKSSVAIMLNNNNNHKPATQIRQDGSRLGRARCLIYDAAAFVRQKDQRKCNLLINHFVLLKRQMKNCGQKATDKPTNIASAYVLSSLTGAVCSF